MRQPAPQTETKEIVHLAWPLGQRVSQHAIMGTRSQAYQAAIWGV